MMTSSSSKSTVNIILWAVIAIGVLLRLYRITANEFLFYDEGMYLGHNRPFLDLVAANPPKSIQELCIILGLMFKAALTMPKALWFFILNLRVFLVGPEGWFYSRIISLVAGLGTIALTYLWARRYFKSSSIALLSAAILAVLPSHVFYSRLGMQEALSAFLFLAGMYFYVFSRQGLSIRGALSAIFLSAVFFTNYRMIIAPIFVLLAEYLINQGKGQGFDFKKIGIFLVIFFGLVFSIGSLDGGVNSYVTFGWMLHQADDAHAHRHWVDFFSFPYYSFVIENFFFGCLFFFNAHLLFKRKFNNQLPFILVIAQMLLFSFAAEKGARYLCVVLPFAAMATAYSIVYIKENFAKQAKALFAVVLVMFGLLIVQSFLLARSTTDYDKAVSIVLSHDANAKIISTQPLVESLFLHDQKQIVACPKDSGEFTRLLEQGYRYLIIDPQAYISWTADGERFTPKLINFLEEIRQRLMPVATFEHIEGVLLTRFVIDHNQNLLTTIRFLSQSQGKGKILVYDLNPGAS